MNRNFQSTYQWFEVEIPAHITCPSQMYVPSHHFIIIPISFHPSMTGTEKSSKQNDAAWWKCISIDRMRSAKNVTKENSKFVYQDSRNSGKTEDWARRWKQNGIARYGIYSIFTIYHPMLSFYIYTYSLSEESEEWRVYCSNKWDMGFHTNKPLDRTQHFFFILHSHSYRPDSLEFSGHLNALTKNEETQKNTTVCQITNKEWIRICIYRRIDENE